MYKRLKAPMVVQFEVTEKCNGRCVHYYNFWRDRSAPAVTGIDFPDERVDQAIEALARAEVFHIVATGGEPLLNRKTLYRVIEKAPDVDLTVGINSNLSCLTRQDAKHFKDHRVTSVLTSILGSNSQRHDAVMQGRGLFVKTVRGIRILQDAGIPVGVNMVITKKNIDDLRNTVRFVKSLGINHLNATKAGCPGNCSDFSALKLSTQEFGLYLEELHDATSEEGMSCDALESYPLCAIKNVSKYAQIRGRKCLAGVTSMTIAPNGDVRPCSHLDERYGNIFLEELSTIWESMDCWASGKFLPTVCTSCKLLRFCGGGCRMDAKTTNGSIYALDPYTSPDDVENIAEQLKMEKKKEPIQIPEQFELVPSARIRCESFGGVVFADGKMRGLLDHEGLGIVARMKKGAVYSLGDITSTNEFFNVTEFVAGMCRKKSYGKGGEIVFRSDRQQQLNCRDRYAISEKGERHDRVRISGK